ncbi:hypothetical protein ATK36_0750 [Amycolatopsis sulphurea]|uniref:Uncharacterized protein n=1 Tax=Amycolatopsis sulphurea TaxID=76022 RepID=A0A2A9G2M1_9PSEU|nr:hypothetical protein [Amycolatopsis sulphurea]PFG57186.1 hypothetical protein ATK36_0750 [Amycolatopsis sulphurea]
MSSNGRSSDEDAVPVYWQSAILRQAFFSALLISVALAALAVLGLFARPHGLWAVPIVCTLLSLVLALRLRLATTYGMVAILSMAVLVLVVAAGSLEALAVHLTHRT